VFVGGDDLADDAFRPGCGSTLTSRASQKAGDPAAETLPPMQPAR
jgi:hypothetical protein